MRSLITKQLPLLFVTLSISCGLFAESAPPPVNTTPPPVSNGSFTNGNFETGDFTGWIQGAGYWEGEFPINPNDYIPGGNKYDIQYNASTVVAGPTASDPRTDGQLMPVFNGNYTAKVNDEYANNSISVISQTVANYNNPHIFFAWAAVLQSSHGPTDSDNFILKLTDDTTHETLYDIAYNSANAPQAALFHRSRSDWYYTDWQIQDLDVSTRMGHTFSLLLMASDCPYGGHAGYVYLDGFGSVNPPTGTIEDPTPGVTITTNGNLGTFTRGAVINTTLSATGGKEPYTWSYAGTLPDGASLDAGGTFRATAGAPGNYGVTAIVTDSVGSSAALTLSYAVFGLTSASLPDIIQFSPYQANIGIAGGTAPYSFTVSGLPPGLSINSAGTILGTVRTTGSSTLTFTVTDSEQHTFSGTLPLNVIAPLPLHITTTALPKAMMGEVYSHNLAATGGAQPYSWSLVSGSLPTGLVFHSSGSITGVPAGAGTASLVVRATDVTGASVTGGVTLTVAPVALTIVNPSPFASGVVGVEYPTQVFSANGGTAPYRFAVTSGALPAGLTLSSEGVLSGTPRTAGSSNFTVTITDAAGATSTAAPVLVIRPFTTDLVLSSGSLLFKQVQGSATLPPSQNVSVQSTTTATPLRYTTSITPSGTNWLTVRPGGGDTPGVITVALNSAALALPGGATPYQATVNVTCAAPSPCAGNSQTILVALDVSIAPPALSLSSDLLSFTSPAGATIGMTQAVTLTNTGGGSVGFASLTCGAAWCSIGAQPTFINAGASSSLNITADPTGLNPGFYRTTLEISASTGSYSLPVTLFIAGDPGISLQPSGVQFSSSVGGVPVGGPNSFYVDSSGASPVSWTASVLPGSNWLTVNTPSGSSSGTDPGTVTFSIDSGIAASLAPGAYYGRIRIAATGIVNSPQDFEVVLSVAPAGTPQHPNPSPGGLLFITGASTPPPPQAVQIATSSVSPLPFQAAAVANDAGTWLSVSAATGIATPGSPAQSLVSVNPVGLKPGVYYGGVNYAFAGAAVRTVNVTVIVTPVRGSIGGASAGVSALLQPKADAPGCTPSLMVAAQTGLVNNFSAPTAWPTPLSLRLVNDCGGAILNGQVVATFSNGDVPLALSVANPQTGLYSATWTPRHSGSQVTINARATAPGFAPAVTTLSGSVTLNPAPVLTPHSTLHVFDPEVGAGLGPGTIVQLYGQFLAPATTVGQTIPLATKLSGTSVLIGGIEAPLFFVSAGQINAQIPFELQTGQQYQVIVNTNGALTTPDSIQLTAVSPGLASLPDGTVIAQHGDGSLVTENAPAKPGEFLVMYVAGLGATDNSVTSGAGSPSTPLARPQASPTLTIGKDSANVLFAGLTPGLVGLYQVNFQVPDSAPNGDLTLVLTQNDARSNSTILPVHN